MGLRYGGGGRSSPFGPPPRPSGAPGPRPEPRGRGVPGVGGGVGGTPTRGSFWATNPGEENVEKLCEMLSHRPFAAQVLSHHQYLDCPLKRLTRAPFLNPPTPTSAGSNAPPPPPKQGVPASSTRPAPMG